MIYRTVICVAVFMWKNLNQNEGFNVKLRGSNNRTIGVKNIQDGEVLQQVRK